MLITQKKLDNTLPYTTSFSFLENDFQLVSQIWIDNQKMVEYQKTISL